ncbi:MAG TPA: adenylyl-sulfate kinase [Opitutaceae bacterium]|nr:adenylyl-sulfate kinase [Opitutaceae bacterium]
MSNHSSAPSPRDRSDASPAHVALVVVGHVDHGKSTLIGRLLFETQSVAEGKAEQIQAACRAEGMEFEYAFLLDALLEEQAQNVTMDTTRVPFRTARRAFTIIDAPGHKEFLKNMVTGAASADAAVLIVDAEDGLREQTRRHGYLLSLLGLKQVIVAVNKMDLVGYQAAVFERIRREVTDFLGRLGIAPMEVVPISARDGEGLIRRSDRMPWHAGPCLIEALEKFHGRAAADAAPLRLNVQDVYRFDARRIVAGQVESGRIAVGDPIMFHPGAKLTRVRSIEVWPLAGEGGGTTPDGGPQPGRTASVASGRPVALTLEDDLFVERGHVGSGPEQPPTESREFVGRLFWLHHEPLRVGDTLPLRLGTQQVEARLVAVARVLDTATLQGGQEPANAVRRHEVAEVRIRTRRPLVFDAAGAFPAQGRFVLMRSGRIGGGGVIDDAVREFGNEMPVTAAARAGLLGHRGAVLWLTGLSGAGKSTLATALERRLIREGVLPVVLDGDVLRAGLCSGLGFSEADRKENIRRAAEAALLMAELGAVVITALISPYRADRDLARERCQTRGVPFAEVYVNASLAECERRDPKGLYQRARAGEIAVFTGITSPYEPPAAPTLELKTDRESIQQSVDQLAALALEMSRPSFVAAGEAGEI